jgi:asparagine synthase (glutamine-hydrolysing)
MVERVDEALMGAVEETMTYAGKVAISLSGGIDSGVVAAAAARVDRSRVVCFTTSYGDDPLTNEIPEATRIAESLGVPIHVVDTSGSHAFRDVDPGTAFRHGIPMQTLAWSHDALATAAVRRGAGVQLSGYGSEVTLAPENSPAYLPELVARGEARRALADLFAWTGLLGRGVIHVAGMCLDARRTIERARPPFLGISNELEHAGYRDPASGARLAHKQIVRFLATKPLVAEDWQLRRSVFDHHPLRVMSPFTSRKLVELCFALPSWMTQNPREHKWLMKEYARRKVPELGFRFNADYFAPDYVGLRRERARLDAYFDGDCRLVAHGIAAPEIIRLIKAFLIDPSYFDYELSNQSMASMRQALFLEMWLRGYEAAT